MCGCITPACGGGTHRRLMVQMAESRLGSGGLASKVDPMPYSNSYFHGNPSETAHAAGGRGRVEHALRVEKSVTDALS